MAKLDKDIVARMMQAGDTDSKIAAVFGTSRQAVNLLRQSFLIDGQLAVLEARKQETAKGPAGERTSAMPTPGPVRPTLDQLTDWMIQIIKDAGETRRLRLECQGAQAKIEALQQEVARLRDELRQTAGKQVAGAQKASEFETAVEQAEVSSFRDTPVIGPHS
jgi:hypothetical protein